MSPVFRKYTRPMSRGRQVTYAMAEVEVSYVGDDGRRGSAKSRTIPVKLGPLTKGEAKKLTRRDVEDAIRADRGENVTLGRIVGLVQLRPESERKGRYFTKEQAETAKRRRSEKRAAARRRARKARS